MKAVFLITHYLCLALFLSGCGGGISEVYITEGSETIGTAREGTMVATSGARLVHVDELARIATIRSDGQFEDGDFVKTVKNGVQTGILKINEPVRPEALRTAYILEGEPSINDLAEPVSVSEAERLSKLYPDQSIF